MKAGSTFFTIFVGLFLLSIVHFYGKEPQKQIEGCIETDRIKTTSAHSFTYCEDNGKVLDARDSTWISPSKYQKRWIETKKIN